MPLPAVRYRRETLDTPDGDFIDVDFVEPDARPAECNPSGATAHGGSGEATVSAPSTASSVSRFFADAPLQLALWHGLEGSSQSPYARTLMAACARRGWRACVVHWRGCGGRPNRLPRAYHSGDTDDVDWAMHRLRPRFAVGVSLGGNALIKWLGEPGRDTSILTAAAAVCPPHALRAGAYSLASGFNRAVYGRHFMRTLVPKSLAMLQSHPGLFDARRVRRARDFIAFDDLVTAPLHGFDSNEDYWSRSSCGPFLAHVRTPLLVLNACNDPFIPRDTLTPPSRVSDHVTLDYQPEGGHVGFVTGRFPGHQGWLAARLFDHFDRFGQTDRFAGSGHFERTVPVDDPGRVGDAHPRQGMMDG